MKISYYSLIISFLIICFACEQKVMTNDTNDEVVTTENESFNFMHYSNAKKMLEIEERIDITRKVTSLNWEKQTKEYGSQFLQVEAFLNEDGMPIKIIEYFIDGNFQPQGERNYYLENNKLIAFQENKDSWIDSNFTEYIETRTVFDENGPALTQTRKAYQFDEIQDSVWINIPANHPTLDKVNRILSGEEEFETHFISVIKADNLYLLLGENKSQDEERYTTAVRVDEMTPFIEDLLNNLEEYKYRPVEIRFTIVGGGDSPEFSVLQAIRWKD